MTPKKEYHYLFDFNIKLPNGNYLTGVASGEWDVKNVITKR